MTLPLISIITVCLNAEKSIEGAIQSVAKQKYPHIEYIVIDGQSTDHTLKILEMNRHVITTLISENDKGIFDAMNKAIRLAKGEIIYFLNADDALHDDQVITAIAHLAQDNPQHLLIQGKTQLAQHNDTRKGHPPYNKPFNSYKAAFTCIPPHQGLFIRKTAFEMIGVFNLRYWLYADYDWFLRAWKNNFKILYTDITVCQYYPFGLSYQQRWQGIPQRMQIVWTNSNPLIFAYYLSYAARRTWKKILSIR